MRVTTTLAVLSLLAAASGALGQPSTVPSAPIAAVPSAADLRARDRVEQHIEDLHARLAITPAQERQWAAFAAIMRQNAQTTEARHRDEQGHLASLSALDGMRSYAAKCRMHADNVDKLLPVFEALYDAMPADQRAATDKTFQDMRRAARPGCQ